jgi:hypothetical protein
MRLAHRIRLRPDGIKPRHYSVGGFFEAAPFFIGRLEEKLESFPGEELADFY